MVAATGGTAENKVAAKTELPSKEVARAPVARPKAGGKQARGASGSELSADERRKLIAQAAYFRAEKRGFAPGYELQDWFEAEAEVRRLIGAA